MAALDQAHGWAAGVRLGQSVGTMGRSQKLAQSEMPPQVLRDVDCGAHGHAGSAARQVVTQTSGEIAAADASAAEALGKVLHLGRLVSPDQPLSADELLFLALLVEESVKEAAAESP